MTADPTRLNAQGPLARRLLQESIDQCPEKCGGVAWRGRRCEFHQGFEDGADAMARALGMEES